MTVALEVEPLARGRMDLWGRSRDPGIDLEKCLAKLAALVSS